MGNVSGTVASDDLSFSEDETIPMQANNTNFLLVNHQNGFENFQAEGLIGLNLHDTQNKKNLIYRLYEQGQISSPRFSLFLSSGSESRLYIGDYSQNTAISGLYRQMRFCAVERKSANWSCAVSAVEVNKKSFAIESKFTLDSGISYLIIPISDFKIIKKQIIEETNSDCIFNENHQLLCRCATPDIFPDLRLKTEGGSFEIKLNKLIDFYPKMTYSCRFEVFVDMNNYDNWVLGANVMKDSLFSFDISARKIGFYQNPDVKAFANKENLVIYTEDNADPKIGYMFALGFIFVMLYAIIKCSNNEKFMSGNSANESFELTQGPGSAVAGNKMEMGKKDFQNRKSDDFEKYAGYKNVEENNLKSNLSINDNKNVNNNVNSKVLNDSFDDVRNKIREKSLEISDGNKSGVGSKKSKNEKYKFLKKDIEVKNEKVENLIDEK